MTEETRESHLVQRAREGDRRAFHELYEQLAPRVYSVARRIVRDEELARDCAQEAWLKAIRGLNSFRGDARFSTWLHRIAVNVSLQTARGVARRRGRSHPMPETIAAPAESGDPLLESRLEAALERIPDGMREVLVLHDVEGYTHEEIGEALGIVPGTSKSQLFKARARMREILGGIQVSALSEPESTSTVRA